MPYDLVEDAMGDKRNAIALAAASQFAYFPADRGEAAFRDELGLSAKLISVDNTQVYVAANDSHVVVAFRGSEGPNSFDGLKDWLLTNALNLLIVPQGPLGADFAAAGVGARWHQGFVSAITEIWEPVFAATAEHLKTKDRPLWVTGHSLGGALALLAAWLFLRRTVGVHQVYTFGAPMVGNKDVADAINREYAGKVFRYVNGPDPVPLLPMMSLVANDFTHCDTAVSLGEAGGAADLVAFCRQLGGGVVGGVISGNISDEVWGAIKGRVAAHLLDDYRKLIG
jgi:triacylglycerol lipase